MSRDDIAALPFADAFARPSLEQWRAAVDKVLKGGDFEKRLVGRSADGIRIEPLYPAAPETPQPWRAGEGRWQICARADHSEPADAGKLALSDLEGGAGALVLSFAGSRAARGHGLAIADVADLDIALDGVMLDLAALRLDPGPQGDAKALLVADLVERRKHPPDALSISFGLDPVGVLAAHGSLPVSWPETARGLASTITGLRERGFAGPFVTVDTRPWHEAGASEAQELAAMLATAVAYLRVLEGQGMALADVRDAIDFTLVADTDEFLTVAKLRAARRLWARVQEACGLAPVPMKLHAETAWRSLTRLDPWVNLLRATTATFAAGIGGADSVTVLPFTAALGLPDAFARRTARNTQLVLLEEANLWRVADPAAGAGGFEALTQGLSEEAWRLFQSIEAQGQGDMPGILAALASGFLQREIARSRKARTKAVATRREPITGTSEFPNLAEAPVSVLAVASTTQPNAAGTAAINVEPLPSLRLAEPFEMLRDRAAGSASIVFLASLGPVAAFSARAGFARNLFEAGGLKTSPADSLANGTSTDLAALAAAFTASGARLACLCGTDEAYGTEGEAAARALKAAGATVWLAGRPGDNEAALNRAGVEAFIFAGCDVVETLGRAQDIVLRS